MIDLNKKEIKNKNKETSFLLFCELCFFLFVITVLIEGINNFQDFLNINFYFIDMARFKVFCCG